MLSLYLYVCEGFGEGEGWNENVSIEWCIVFFVDFKMKDELLGVWKDGGKCNGFCYLYEGCGWMVS